MVGDGLFLSREAKNNGDPRTLKEGKVIDIEVDRFSFCYFAFKSN